MGLRVRVLRERMRELSDVLKSSRRVFLETAIDDAGEIAGQRNRQLWERIIHDLEHHRRIRVASDRWSALQQLIPTRQHSTEVHPTVPRQELCPRSHATATIRPQTNTRLRII